MENNKDLGEIDVKNNVLTTKPITGTEMSKKMGEIKKMENQSKDNESSPDEILARLEEKPTEKPTERPTERPTPGPTERPTEPTRPTAPTTKPEDSTTPPPSQGNNPTEHPYNNF